MPGSKNATHTTPRPQGSGSASEAVKRRRREQTEDMLETDYTDEEMGLLSVTEYGSGSDRECSGTEVTEIFNGILRRLFFVERDLDNHKVTIESQEQTIKELRKKNRELWEEKNKLEERMNVSERKQNEADMEVNQPTAPIDLGKWKTKLKIRGEKNENQPQVMPKEQVDFLNNITSEIKDQEKKKSNVVIFGMRESEKEKAEERKKEDEDGVSCLLQQIGVKANVTIKRVTRYSKNKSDPTKTPIVVVELNDEKERNKVLYASKKLRDSEHTRNIYINADMTNVERSKLKELIELRNQKNKENTDKKIRWGIRNDMVVKIRNE